MKPDFLLHGSAVPFEEWVKPNRTVASPENLQVSAGLDEKKALAYALKNGNINAMRFTAELSGWTFVVVDSRQEFYNGLHKSKKGLGGFIYKVDAASFKPLHPSGQGEWVSEDSAKIISRRFVRLKDVMKEGVQIFIYESSDCFEKLRNMSVSEMGTFLMDGFKDGSVNWLNQKCHINPMPLPPVSLQSGLSHKKPLP